MMLFRTRTRRRSRLPFPIALLALAGAAAGQTQVWTQSLQAPHDRLGGYAAAFDAARGRLVAFGQDTAQSPTTWEWDGQHWIACRPAHSPPALLGQRMFYDSTRQRTVLILGSQNLFNNLDAWLWDGEDWTNGGNQWLPAVATTPAFDSVRGRGVVPSSFFSLTFEWDGSTWTVVSPTAPPGLGQMVFDAARQQTVMFASDRNTLTCGTWTWDGSSWTRQQPVTSPPMLFDSVMAFDAARQRVVLSGGTILGASGSSTNRDTWEWDGANWTCVANASLPVPYPNPGALYFDPAIQQVVLLATGTYAFARWRWDGTAWQSMPVLLPPDNYDASCAFDFVRDQAVRFGGFAAGSPTLSNDTWVWEGANWIRRQPTTSPPARRNHVLVADSARGRVLLFGGLQTVAQPNWVPLGDTWLWDGRNWTQAQPSAAPPARAFAKAAYDDSRLRIVMFGGAAGSSAALGDTWEWDGSNWQLMVPAQAPPARACQAMAFDPLRGLTVLFGGIGAAGWTELGDTWVWNGSNWFPATATGPQPRQCSAMAFDSRRSRMLLIGGYDSQPSPLPPQLVFHDAWEWDGQAWTSSTLQLPTATSWPMDLYDIGLFEDRFARLVLNTKEHGTWIFKQPQPASIQTLGPGCGSPQTNLLADPPYLGNTGFAMTMTGAPPLAPSVLLLGLPSPPIPIGAGCSLHMTSAHAFLFAVVDNSGVAQWRCGIPSSPSSIGATVHAQAAALGGGGLLLTPGRRLRLGD